MTCILYVCHTAVRFLFSYKGRVSLGRVGDACMVLHYLRVKRIFRVLQPLLKPEQGTVLPEDSIVAHT